MDQLIKKESSTELDESHAGREQLQNIELEAARRKTGNLLFTPFRNETGIANLGHGSFSGINVRDLKGNVVSDEKIDPSYKGEDQRTAFSGFPLLRYINFGSESIELKIYGKNERIVASKTTDGIIYKEFLDTANKAYVGKNPFEAFVFAVAERACKTQPSPKKSDVDEVFEYDKLSAPQSVADEENFTKQETAPIESTGNWPTDEIYPLGFDPSKYTELRNTPGKDLAQILGLDTASGKDTTVVEQYSDFVVSQE